MKLKKLNKLLLISAIAIAIIIYVSVTLSREGFQTIDPTNHPGGNFIAMGLRGSLKDIYEIFKTIPPEARTLGYVLKDCNDEIIIDAESMSDNTSYSTTPGKYYLYLATKVGGGQFPKGTDITRQYSEMVTQTQGSGISLVSMLFSNYEYPAPMCRTDSTSQTGSIPTSEMISNILNKIFTPEIAATILGMSQMFF